MPVAARRDQRQPKGTKGGPEGPKAVWRGSRQPEADQRWPEDAAGGLGGQRWPRGTTCGSEGPKEWLEEWLEEWLKEWREDWLGGFFYLPYGHGQSQGNMSNLLIRVR